MIRSIVAVFLVLAAAAGGAYWYFVMLPAQMASATAGAPGRGGPPAGFAMPVEAGPVRVGTSQRQVLAVGTIRSNESVIIRPEIAGRITQINFVEGQKVKKGQVLVQLDSSIERAELAQAQAALVLAKANYERADELVKRNAGTGRALDEARAALRTQEAAVQLSQARLDKFTLVAPFDSMIGLRKMSIGDYVSGGAELVNVEMVDPLKVDFRVPEIFLASLRTGQKAAISIDALSDRKFEAEVFAIDPLVDQAGRSVVIRARVPNPDDVLRPGLFARVLLTIEERKNAVFVAEQSLIPVGDQHFVFKVVDKDGAKVVALTKVKIGERRKGEVEIIEGLAAGDSVVTAGLLKIRDGMPIQIVPASPPSVANGAAQG
jgi:membrane fusion protein, multidrug efflux system